MNLQKTQQLCCWLRLILASTPNHQTTIPVWRGWQRQHEVGLSDEGPVGKPVQSQQPLKQQDFADKSEWPKYSKQNHKMYTSHQLYKTSMLNCMIVTVESGYESPKLKYSVVLIHLAWPWRWKFLDVILFLTHKTLIFCVPLNEILNFKLMGNVLRHNSKLL